MDFVEGSEFIVSTGDGRTYPEGITGLSLGFQPQDTPTSRLALKGRKTLLIEGVFWSLGSTATFGAGRSFYQCLGLKPHAESYYPFGISPTVPCRDDFRDESVGHLYQLSTHAVQLKVGLRF